MKKALRRICLWPSVPSGLIIAVIYLSGAALVSEDEVTELCRYGLYYVEKAGGVPLPAGHLIGKVAETLPNSAIVMGVSISFDAGRAYQVSLSKLRRVSIYVDQYTGEVKGRNEYAPLFLTMFRLHRWLMDSMKPGDGAFWGKVIVGVSTLMLVFVSISGAVIWWLHTKKVLKNSLKIAVSKGWWRFWYGLHVAGGMYALVFLLIMASAGFTWSFSWYRTGFYKMFGAGMKQEGHGKERKGRTSYACWQQVYEELKARNADYRLITTFDDSAGVSFVRLGNRRAVDRYSFNPQNGETIRIVLCKDTDTSDKIRGWIYSIRVRSWGSIVTCIMAFIAALSGGTLSPTDYYLWMRRIGRI